MQETQTTTEGRSDAQRANKLYMESNLLRISGALFCHDPKRAARRTGEIELNAGVVEKHIVIRPDPKLGQPGQLAHKIFAHSANVSRQARGLNSLPSGVQ